jgi:hypothetical protein
MKTGSGFKTCGAFRRVEAALTERPGDFELRRRVRASLPFLDCRRQRWSMAENRRRNQLNRNATDIEG